MLYNHLLVSVVIPCYNSENWIAKAIQSIDNQTFKNIEIIIVDDGSTDNSVNVIKNIKISLPILIINQENSGPSLARNNGVKYAKGDYIAFLDADDEWHPDKIQTQLDALDLNNKKNFCLSDCILIDANNSLIKKHSNNIDSSTSLDLMKKMFYLGEVSMITPSILVPKQLFIDSGGFDNNLRYKEDNFFILKLLSEKGILTYINKPLFSVRFHKNSGRNRDIKKDLLLSLARFNNNVSQISPELLTFKNHLDIKIYSIIVKSYLGKSLLNSLYWSIKIIRISPSSKHGYILFLLSLLPFKKNTYIKMKEKINNVLYKNN
ncbi:glycosyltransferase [Providencia stuartii]|uniref:glycosyltransferase family 2 protein n=1 Tax=Providencia stuartii TaxID=588 RepID=UPI0018C7AEC5|nr:glycosyltransferase [Providencia stuartii]MBG5898367.1 glycosyltransferase [Providencia stuartii]MDT7052198.1 glycosyltransferase [Providencia stuartii]